MVIPVLKKNSVHKIGMLVFSLFLFSSCVTWEQDLLHLNDQVVALNKRLNKLEQSIDNLDTKLSGELESRLDVIRESQAETGDEIDKVRDEIQDLSGRVEDNRHLVKRAIERDTTDQDVAKANVADLTSRITELETEVKELRERLGPEPSAELTQQEPKKAPEPLPVIEKKTVSPEKELYDLTLANYKEEKYEEAIVGFKSFLKKYPKSDLADNAHFWIGESYMALKQYEQAILAYQEVIKKYPKGNKVANAMLRQALAFYEIKDKISSKLLLKKIIKKYPRSDEAKIAKAKLKTLK